MHIIDSKALQLDLVSIFNTRTIVSIIKRMYKQKIDVTVQAGREIKNIKVNLKKNE